MKVEEAIDKRRSIRKFATKAVKWSDILEAIDAAIKAPFAGNVHALQFIIVQDKNMIHRIAECTQQDWVAEAPAIVVVCSTIRSLEGLYKDRAESYLKQEVGAAIENFLLRIVELGLSSCWIGAFTDENLKDELRVPDNYEVEAILPVGYQSPRLKVKPIKKAPLETSINWDLWGVKKKPVIFKDPRTW